MTWTRCLKSLPNFLISLRSLFQMIKIKAIIQSMSEKERLDPSLLNPSRKNRIAKGSGVNIADVNRLVKQFEQMKKMMKQFPGMMKNGKKRGALGGLFGGKLGF